MLKYQTSGSVAGNLPVIEGMTSQMDLDGPAAGSLSAGSCATAVCHGITTNSSIADAEKRGNLRLISATCRNKCCVALAQIVLCMHNRPASAYNVPRTTRVITTSTQSMCFCRLRLQGMQPAIVFTQLSADADTAAQQTAQALLPLCGTYNQTCKLAEACK